MNLKKRLEKIEAGIPCPECSGSGNVIPVAWNKKDLEAYNRLPDKCPRCGKEKPPLIGAGFPFEDRQTTLSSS